MHLCVYAQKTLYTQTCNSSEKLFIPYVLGRHAEGTGFQASSRGSTFLGQVVLQIGPKNPSEGTQEPESRTHIFATGYYGLKTGSLRLKDGFKKHGFNLV